MTAVTQAFDTSMSNSTGDIWSAGNGLSSGFAPMYAPSGDSANMTVVVTPTAAKATVVSGTI